MTGLITWFCFTWMLLVLFGLTVWYRASKDRHPDAAIVDALLTTLSLLETKPRRWHDVAFRHGLAVQLEEDADSLERQLPVGSMDLVPAAMLGSGKGVLA